LKRFLGIGKPLAGLSLVLALGVPAEARDPKVGEPAPPAELVLIDGTKIKLADLRGQVVVLNFWATWCVPCRTELPLLDNYYRVQKRGGLRVFAVTTEDSLPTYKLKPLFAAMAIDPVRKIKGPFTPIRNAVPTNYIIDRAGKVRYAKAGALDLEALNREIVPLMNERAPQ
jgi:cytochrome c biogenesis protein CcmG/thiol:disulfide interchange protein DsbE